MTLKGNVVWACYYSEFPIVRIDEQKNVTKWNNEIAGAHAIAADGKRALLSGGYAESQNRCVVQTLKQTGEVGAKMHYRLLLPEGIDATNVFSRVGGVRKERTNLTATKAFANPY